MINKTNKIELKGNLLVVDDQDGVRALLALFNREGGGRDDGIVGAADEQQRNSRL